jgi:hypothetical protein
MTATFILVLRVALAIVLYYFLWRIIQTLWQDLKQQGSILSLRKKPGIHIHANANGVKEYDFWQEEILIGRGPHCDISIKDESISVNHARLSFHHAQWWLEDLGSTNGTTLNKDQINTPTVIINDDQFKCGNTTFMINIDPFNQQFPKQLKPENGGDE